MLLVHAGPPGPYLPFTFYPPLSLALHLHLPCTCLEPALALPEPLYLDLDLDLDLEQEPHCYAFFSLDFNWICNCPQKYFQMLFFCILGVQIMPLRPLLVKKLKTVPTRCERLTLNACSRVRTRLLLPPLLPHLLGRHPPSLRRQTPLLPNVSKARKGSPSSLSRRR